MSQIWYAAFSEDFVGQAQKIFKKLDRDVIVTVWDPELVPEMLRRGVSVILGRGATALRIDVYKRQGFRRGARSVPCPVADCQARRRRHHTYSGL